MRMDQPRRLGQVFRDAFAITGRRFGVLITLSSLLILMRSVFALYACDLTEVAWNVVIYGEDFSDYAADPAFWIGVAEWVSLIFVVPLVAAYHGHVVFMDLCKERPTATECLGRAAKNYPRMLASLLCLGLFLLADKGLALLGGLLQYRGHDGWLLMGGGALVDLVRGGVFFLFLHCIYAVPQTIYPGYCGFGALKRGFGLFTRNGYGRNLGHTLLALGAIMLGSEMLSSLALAGGWQGGALSQLYHVIGVLVKNAVLVAGMLFAGTANLLNCQNAWLRSEERFNRK